MKKSLLLVSFVLFACQVGTRAQPTAPNVTTHNSKEVPRFDVVARGANYKLWQRVISESDTGGEAYTRIVYYTELASGMHYLKDGQWIESEAKIEITKDGAAATKGAHKVNFAANINTVGAIDFTAPDGKQLRSHVLGLSYLDTATGKSAMIGEIKDSIGVLHPPNQIIYPDAFTDIKASLRFTYTKVGFEQDVIILEKIPSPEEYGLNPATTRLEVLTEFIDPPQPVKTARRLKNQAIDEALDFGSVRIGQGSAFSLSESNSPAAAAGFRHSAQATPVQKTWTKLDGRDFLIEEVPFQSIKAEIEKLPASKEQAANKSGGGLRRASLKRKLPTHREAKIQNKKMDVASAPSKQKGFVLDYVIYDYEDWFTDFTFQGDTTYYLSGDIHLSGTTTIEGGAVIKISPDTGQIWNDGSFDCKTDAYKPAVFTSRDDDSVGETISESTGTPSYYWTCFGIDGENPNLKNIRISWATWAITYWSIGDVAELRNVQFYQCGSGVDSKAGTVNLRNVLFSDCYYIFFGNDYTNNCENVTVNRCFNQLTACWSGAANSVVHFTNSLAIATTNLGDAYTITTNYSFVITTVRLSFG